MTVSGSITVTASMPGMGNNSTVHSRSAAGSIAQNVALAAAKTGTLSTRTSDTAGTLTMTAGHGITDGQIIAIFHPTSGVSYLATVGTVATNSVPFTGAAGDVLPAQASAVTVQVMTDLNVDFDGDDLELLLAKFTKRGVVVFEDSGDAVLDAEEVPAGEGYYYVADTLQANPLTGNAVDQIWIANGDSSETNTFSFGCLYNSDV